MVSLAFGCRIEEGLGLAWLAAALRSVMNPQDESLANRAMDRYASGDDSAFAELYDIVAPRLYGFLLKQLRNQALAEDCLQQALLQLHAARGRYVHGSPVLPWVFAIARRVAIDKQRRGSTERRIVRDDDEIHEIAAPHGDPHGAAHAGQLAERMLCALEKLPDSLREPYLLVREGGLSMREAAMTLGITEVAARLRVSRATRALREALQQEGFLELPELEETET